MGFLDAIAGVLDRYRTGTAAASPEEAHRHYDQIAENVPKDVLASTIGPALGSLATPEVEEKVARSAASMSPEQRAGFLSDLLSGLGAGAGLQALLNQIGVSPSVAQNPQNATPQDVAKVAGYTKDNNPDLFHEAMGFYAEHPTLVKVMGTMAIAAIAQHLSGGRRPGLV